MVIIKTCTYLIAMCVVRKLIDVPIVFLPVFKEQGHWGKKGSKQRKIILLQPCFLSCQPSCDHESCGHYWMMKSRKDPMLCPVSQLLWLPLIILIIVVSKVCFLFFRFQCNEKMHLQAMAPDTFALLMRTWMEVHPKNGDAWELKQSYSFGHSTTTLE